MVNNIAANIVSIVTGAFSIAQQGIWGIPEEVTTVLTHMEDL